MTESAAGHSRGTRDGGRGGGGGAEDGGGGGSDCSLISVFYMDANIIGSYAFVVVVVVVVVAVD